MEKEAILDQKRKYRYVLKRQWGTNEKNFVNFVLLNPSTADEKIDDPTIQACIKFAQNWKYDGMWVTNLFAFRTTQPINLKKNKRPIGNKNDSYIQKYAKKSKTIVIAWGNHGNFLNRDKQVIKLLSQISDLYCLQILKNGQPKHPLYVKRQTKLLIFYTHKILRTDIKEF